MNLISKLFEKHGLDFNELNETERQTYEQWQKILDKPNLTIPQIITWLASEKQRTELALEDYAMNEKKRIFLQATSRLIRMLTAILTAPEQEKRQLQSQIEQMLKQSPNT